MLSGKGHEFLAALITFIQPSLSTLDSTETSLPNGGVSALKDNISDGEKLLGCLRDFITEAMTAQPHVKDNVANEQATPRNDLHIVGTVARRMSLDININAPNVMRSQELPIVFLEASRMHVFNKMPIRVLSFDENGENLQLLERNGMLHHINHRALVEFNEQMHDQKGSSKWLVSSVGGYAILSHTWIRDRRPGDVVYGDWNNRTLNQYGYRKISKFCEVAAQHSRVRLAWMDTVCINKDSSTELDESIRSMYKWYNDARVCVAYLSETQDLENMHTDSWFTRGWTLQELLAPKVIKFYNKDWKQLSTSQVDIGTNGTHYKPAESDLQIQKATTLTWPELELYYRGQINKIPLSRIMQLAAIRKVTREEDSVYSLMGLLRVEISVAYGEGLQRALFRLIREVVSSKRYFLDIFNCGYSSSHTLIPSSIADYLHRSSAFDEDLGSRFAPDTSLQPREPIILTHLGLRMQLLLVPALSGMSKGHEYIPRGDFSAVIMLDPLSRHLGPCYLLDKTIYTAQMINRIRQSGNYYPPYQYDDRPKQDCPFIVSFGILNFGQSGANDSRIDLPLKCLSVPLWSKILDGNIGLTDTVNILKQEKPIVFKFSRSSKRSVPKTELGKHGMQVVTLYL